MRRAVFVIALAAVSCHREQPSQPVSRHPSPVSSQPSAVTGQPSVVSREPIPKTPLRSTPQHCAGDGSYAAAVDCVRIAAALHFKSSDGAGDMIRKTPGAERLTLGTSDGQWNAEAKPAGVVWTHDGKPVKDVPRKLEKLWERLTVFPDPQKKEGAPKLSMEGNVRRYDFTDANTGDRYRVWVAPDDGHITKLQVNDWMIEFA
ncbi:MAG TPA: hypothetical protein VF219_22500 [Vicinamibacterales bacterium]